MEQNKAMGGPGMKGDGTEQLIVEAGMKRNGT
jgi:hypothetical protein